MRHAARGRSVAPAKHHRVPAAITIEPYCLLLPPRPPATTLHPHPRPVRHAATGRSVVAPAHPRQLAISPESPTMHPHRPGAQDHQAVHHRPSSPRRDEQSRAVLPLGISPGVCSCTSRHASHISSAIHHHHAHTPPCITWPTSRCPHTLGAHARPCAAHAPPPHAPFMRPPTRPFILYLHPIAMFMDNSFESCKAPYLHTPQSFNWPHSPLGMSQISMTYS